MFPMSRISPEYALIKWIPNQLPQQDYVAKTGGMEFSTDREQAMEPGDYIRMPWAEYRSWGANYGRDYLPTQGEVLVTFVGMKRKKPGKSEEAIYTGGGGLTLVHPSLFYNNSRVSRRPNIG